MLHPACNYVQIMEQHLQLLAMGQPVLKPVYDHHTGQFIRPVLVEPRQFVIVGGLLPLHTKLARACFDATVYLDPPEPIRREWKIRRDTAERGYTAEAVRAELEPGSAPTPGRPHALAGPGRASAQNRWPSPSSCSCATCSTRPVRTAGSTGGRISGTGWGRGIR